MSDRIRVIEPVHLPADIPCERIPLRPGARMGYKPNVVQLSNGDLLLANFHTHYEVYDDGSMCEHMVLHRSTDGGRTWTSRHHEELLGREPYLNRFSGDVLIITTHFLEQDVRNQTGHTTVHLHRSEDGGETWSSSQVDVDMIPDPVSYTYTSRNIVELEDGSYVLGVGCGYGKDYLFRSRDRGRSWQVERLTTHGFDAPAYQYSILQEGIFARTASGRLLLFSRCEAHHMDFDQPIPGLPRVDLSDVSDSDHYDVEILFESRDQGRTWSPVNGIPVVGCMYPSLCPLDETRYLFTYTQRVPLPERPMGVYALILEERPDGRFHADPGHDLLVIDEKTPDYFDSGGGFGNTLRLEDGTLVTPYSYLDADPEVEELMRTGRYMDREIFQRYRNRALPYYRSWVSNITWEKIKDSDAVMRQHCFMGFCIVLHQSGPVTEICRWNLPV